MSSFVDTVLSPGEGLGLRIIWRGLVNVLAQVKGQARSTPPAFTLVCRAALLSCLAGVSGLACADEVDFWLDKMSQAMNQQNFRGILVIRQNDKMQAIKVKQGVTAEGSWQTLESLTGEDQTIFRNNRQVTTIFPSKKLVTISNNKSDKLAGVTPKGPMHPNIPQNRRELRQHYTLQLSGEDRIANKHTQIIRMTPRDKHRYGYSFWLDKETGLLLKCDLVDEKGRVLEQLMYSDLELLSETPQNHIDLNKLSVYQKINLSEQNDIIEQRWQAGRMPAGFRLKRTVQTRQRHNPVYHMVYSDGMASVSVFIEQRMKVDKPVMGQSTMGPVNAYSSFMNGVYITAIGEVPVATVRMIAQSIHRVD